MKIKYFLCILVIIFTVIGQTSILSIKLQESNFLSLRNNNNFLPQNTIDYITPNGKVMLFDIETGSIYKSFSLPVEVFKNLEWIFRYAMANNIIIIYAVSYGADISVIFDEKQTIYFNGSIQIQIFNKDFMVLYESMKYKIYKFTQFTNIGIKKVQLIKYYPLRKKMSYTYNVKGIRIPLLFSSGMYVNSIDKQKILYFK